MEEIKPPSAYFQQRELWDYLTSLPAPLRQRILSYDTEITTLGELMQVAEHLRQTEFPDLTI